MTLKLIMATGLVTLALLAGCNKAEEAAEVKTATTEQTPAAAAESAPAPAPVAESTPATEAAPAPVPATEAAPAAK